MLLRYIRSYKLVFFRDCIRFKVSGSGRWSDIRGRLQHLVHVQLTYSMEQSSFTN
jgi:hypothetical protein